MSEKSKSEEKPYRVRNGLLESLLLIQVIGVTIGIIRLYNDIAAYAALSAEYGVSIGLGWSSYAQLIIYILIIICSIGLWQWKTWGYKGLITLYIVGFILSLVKIDIFLVLAYLAGAVVLEFALKDKKDWLE